MLRAHCFQTAAPRAASFQPRTPRAPHPLAARRRILAIVSLAAFSVSCAYGMRKPPLSAALADPWEAIETLGAEQKIAVGVAELGDDPRRIVRLAGRFVATRTIGAGRRGIVMRIDADRFSREPVTGDTSLLVTRERPGSARRMEELHELPAVDTIRRGRQVEVTFDEESIWSVSRPNVYRWAGPLMDCAFVGAIGAGIGALAGAFAGNAVRGGLLGAIPGCAFGVSRWYGDRSDTRALEWDVVYERSRR